MSDTSHDRLHVQGGVPSEFREAAAAAYAKLSLAAPFAGDVLIRHHGVVPVGAAAVPETAYVEQAPAVMPSVEQSDTDRARDLIRQAIGE